MDRTRYLLKTEPSIAGACYFRHRVCRLFLPFPGELLSQLGIAAVLMLRLEQINIAARLPALP